MLWKWSLKRHIRLVKNAVLKERNATAKTLLELNLIAWKISDRFHERFTTLVMHGLPRGGRLMTDGFSREAMVMSESDEKSGWCQMMSQERSR